MLEPIKKLKATLNGKRVAFRKLEDGRFQLHIEEITGVAVATVEKNRILDYLARNYGSEDAQAVVAELKGKEKYNPFKKKLLH